MTLTEAVNACLRGIGLRPVSSYEDPNLNAAMALAIINTESRTVQCKGWWFNEEGGWMLTPDSNGEVQVPNNALSITPWGNSRGLSITIRGGKLYNTCTHSTIVSDVVDSSGAIEVRMIVELPFEDLPTPAQDYIKDKAVRKFAQDVDGDVNKWKFNSTDEAESKAILYSEETSNTKRNASQNPATAFFMARVGGVNSFSGGGMFTEKWRQQ